MNLFKYIALAFFILACLIIFTWLVIRSLRTGKGKPYKKIKSTKESDNNDIENNSNKSVTLKEDEMSEQSEDVEDKNFNSRSGLWSKFLWGWKKYEKKNSNKKK